MIKGKGKWSREETLEEEIVRFMREERCAFVKDALECSIWLDSKEYKNSEECKYPRIREVLLRSGEQNLREAFR